MKFLHTFIIYLLLVEESDYSKWQEEGFINEEKVAEEAFDENMKLLKDGSEIKLKEWALEIIEEMKNMNNTLKLGIEESINFIEERIITPEKTYSRQLSQLIKEEGFVKSQLRLSKEFKHESYENFDHDKIASNKELLECYKDALPLLEKEN